jgi:hypothetical protein
LIAQLSGFSETLSAKGSWSKEKNPRAFELQNIHQFLARDAIAGHVHYGLG